VTDDAEKGALRTGGRHCRHASAVSDDAYGKRRRDKRESGAVLCWFFGRLESPTSQGTDAVSFNRSTAGPGAVGSAMLNQVLGDGAKDSGGRHDQVITTTHAKAVEQVAEELLHQYEIKYALPDGKPADKISVSTKRKGLTLHAPSHVPN
jgi:hypothetical protein